MDFATADRILSAAQNESVSRRYPGRLDRMRAFLAALGNPERSFASVHVGGTAGKGSTASMIAAILTHAGYKVGLHTKPHLRSVTERASIGGVHIAPDRFAEVMSTLLPAIDEMEGTEWGKPSYFELLVALALRYFALERVDIAVVEVGIGGTLDGTNVLEPLASVLTNVGLDHTDVLGDTVEAIATDKAGIIKRDTPVITAADHPDAQRVIAQRAEQMHAPLLRVREIAKIEPLPDAAAYSQTFAVATPRARHEITIPLMGEFQLINAATAIVALEAIGERFPTRSGDVSGGLSSLALPGRMEFYPSRPSLLFDIAHNHDKAAALAAALARHFPGKRFVFVVAIAEGKDAAAMIETWSQLPVQFIFTSFDVSHRAAAQPRSLELIAQSFGAAARAVADPVEALSVARRIAGGDDLVVVTGSTFLVGLLGGWFLENAGAHGHARV
ncbi:MAG: bifunctional folylpolyglutamate synthase/dihydrofolate synthase [Candidatus Eremiobacteraeota bacterium]|nr:bifunctional folylpolyglutamate synthase/dihydrofolate synthase [Candidatus Eremiobacteraeota bacterium]MBV8281928.1 bifunctional folylpolyglutamate synthase/dihydrofolate synthase [Candidatus Eremiobacteraeota bacterium]